MCVFQCAKFVLGDFFFDSVAFMRPVVVFGPVADIGRDKLLKEMPEFFESPRKLPYCV